MRILIGGEEPCFFENTGTIWILGGAETEMAMVLHISGMIGRRHEDERDAKETIFCYRERGASHEIAKSA